MLARLEHDGSSDGQQHAIAGNHLAPVGVVDARQRNLLGGDELPDVELRPIAQRECTELLALADASVQQIPGLGSLVAWIPPALLIAERQDAFLGTGLVLVAAATAERGVEAMLR